MSALTRSADKIPPQPSSAGRAFVLGFGSFEIGVMSEWLR